MPPLNGCAGYGTNQPGCATPRCACADGGRRKLRHALERRERRPKKGTRHDCWRWRLGGSRTFEANAGCAWMSSASNGWFVIAGRADGAPFYARPAYSQPLKQLSCLPFTGDSPAGPWDRCCIEPRDAAVVRPFCLAGAHRAGRDRLGTCRDSGMRTRASLSRARITARVPGSHPVHAAPEWTHGLTAVGRASPGHS